MPHTTVLNSVHSQQMTTFLAADNFYPHALQSCTPLIHGVHDLFPHSLFLSLLTRSPLLPPLIILPSVLLSSPQPSFLLAVGLGGVCVCVWGDKEEDTGINVSSSSYLISGNFLINPNFLIYLYSALYHFGLLSLLF